MLPTRPSNFVTRFHPGQPLHVPGIGWLPGPPHSLMPMTGSTLYVVDDAHAGEVHAHGDKTIRLISTGLALSWMASAPGQSSPALPADAAGPHPPAGSARPRQPLAWASARGPSRRCASEPPSTSPAPLTPVARARSASSGATRPTPTPFELGGRRRRQQRTRPGPRSSRPCPGRPGGPRGPRQRAGAAPCSRCSRTSRSERRAPALPPGGFPSRSGRMNSGPIARTPIPSAPGGRSARKKWTDSGRMKRPKAPKSAPIRPGGAEARKAKTRHLGGFSWMVTPTGFEPVLPG